MIHSDPVTVNTGGAHLSVEDSDYPDFVTQPVRDTEYVYIEVSPLRAVLGVNRGIQHS